MEMKAVLVVAIVLLYFAFGYAFNLIMALNDKYKCILWMADGTSDYPPMIFVNVTAWPAIIAIFIGYYIFYEWPYELSRRILYPNEYTKKKKEKKWLKDQKSNIEEEIDV